MRFIPRTEAEILLEKVNHAFSVLYLTIEDKADMKTIIELRTKIVKRLEALIKEERL